METTLEIQAAPKGWFPDTANLRKTLFLLPAHYAIKLTMPLWDSHNISSSGLSHCEYVLRRDQEITLNCRIDSW